MSGFMSGSKNGRKPAPRVSGCVTSRLALCACCPSDHLPLALFLPRAVEAPTPARPTCHPSRPAWPPTRRSDARPKRPSRTRARSRSACRSSSPRAARLSSRRARTTRARPGRLTASPSPSLPATCARRASATTRGSSATASSPARTSTTSSPRTSVPPLVGSPHADSVHELTILFLPTPAGRQIQGLHQPAGVQGHRGRERQPGLVRLPHRARQGAGALLQLAGPAPGPRLDEVADEGDDLARLQRCVPRLACVRRLPRTRSLTPLARVCRSSAPQRRSCRAATLRP